MIKVASFLLLLLIVSALPEDDKVHGAPVLFHPFRVCTRLQCGRVFLILGSLAGKCIMFLYRPMSVILGLRLWLFG